MLKKDRLTDIKIVFTDLDKTLLNNEKELSAWSKHTLLKLRRRGIPLVLSTARIYRTAQRFYDALDCSGIIYCNGAVVKYGDRTLRECKMDDTAVHDVICGVLDEAPKTTFSVMTTSAMLTNSALYNDTVVIKDYLTQNYVDSIRIILYGLDVESEQRLQRKWGQVLRIVRLEGKNVLVCSKEATKANGVKSILDYLGLRKDEAAVFGDDWNDLESMESVGYGIAVANADEEINRRAKYHCGPNYEDGVAKWVREHLL